MIQPTQLFGFLDAGQTQGVVPVLIGPMQVFLAMLPTILLAIGAVIVKTAVSMFMPGTWKKIGQFLWQQKLFSAILILLTAGFVYASRHGFWLPRSDGGGIVREVQAGREWPSFRGGMQRTGAADTQLEPISPTPIWSTIPRIGNEDVKTIYSSPTLTGNRLYITSALQTPFSDHGGLHCLDADTGAVVWTYAPNKYRATFSSPAVVYEKKEDGTPDTEKGYVVAGEGLHTTYDAQVVCLDLQGKEQWVYRIPYQKGSHFEATPAIADGRVFIGAGTGGYFCFQLKPEPGSKEGKILWRLQGEEYPDCECSPVVVDGVCYVGLGTDDLMTPDKGNALLALDAATGRELWRIKTPFQVFGPATVWKTGGAAGESKEGEGATQERTYLAFGMGWGDFVNSAEAMRALKKRFLVDEKNLTDAEAEARVSVIKPGGAVWCVDLTDWLAEGKKRTTAPPPVLWKQPVQRTVLGAIARTAAPRLPGAPVDPGASGRLYFGSRDNNFYCLDDATGAVVDKFDVKEPIVTSPAVGIDYAYVASVGGTLYCINKLSMSEVWRTSLGDGANFFSSPALGRTHIYIGTEKNGLRCIGSLTPPTPFWQAKEDGGAADLSPISPAGEVKWNFPSPGENQAPLGYRTSSPLMALDEILPNEDLQKGKQPKAFLYAGAVRSPAVAAVQAWMADQESGGEAKLAKPAPVTTGRGVEFVLERYTTTLAEGTKDRTAWSVPLDSPLAAPMGGVGERIYVLQRADDLDRFRKQLLEGEPAAGADQQAEVVVRKVLGTTDAKVLELALGTSDLPTIAGRILAPAEGRNVLRCLNTVDGQEVWSLPLDAQASGRFIVSLDKRGIFGYLAPGKLVGYDLAREARGGKQVELRPAPATGQGESAESIWTVELKGTPVGAPVLRESLIAAATTEEIVLLDARTGARIWTLGVDGLARPTLTPVLTPRHLLVPTEEGLVGVDLVFGCVAWNSAIGRPALPPSADETTAAVTTADGKLHVLQTDDGKPWVMEKHYCLGVDHPATTMPNGRTRRAWQERVGLTVSRGRWVAETRTGQLPVIFLNDAWYIRQLSAETYFKGADGWFVQTPAADVVPVKTRSGTADEGEKEQWRDLPNTPQLLTPLVRTAGGWARVNKDRSLDVVVKAGADSELAEGWYKTVVGGQLVAVTSTGSQHSYTAADGSQVKFIEWPARTPDGGYVQIEGAQLGLITTRMAAVQQVDVSVAPVLTEDGVLCSAKRTLTYVKLPTASLSDAPFGTAVVLNEEESKPATLSQYGSNKSWLAPILSPLVIYDSNVVFSTEAYGIVNCK